MAKDLSISEASPMDSDRVSINFSISTFFFCTLAPLSGNLSTSFWLDKIAFCLDKRSFSSDKDFFAIDSRKAFSSCSNFPKGSTLPGTLHPEGSLSVL